MQRQSYPFCPHGQYVGGSGADHMCGSCEMGEESPTWNEMAELRRQRYSKYMKFVDGVMSVHFNLKPKLVNIFGDLIIDYLRDLQSTIRSYDHGLEEIALYMKDEDDPNWIYERWRQQMAEWDEQTGEEQFQALPGFVLDGG